MYSILVLKLDDETLLPLEGWQINLYTGHGCTGSPITSQSTNEDGLAEFNGLADGPYSVEEKMQSGWNPVTDPCQDVDVGAVGSSSGVPPCPIVPNAEHPQPGCDLFLSGARVTVRINASGETTPVTLSGMTQIVRENKPVDKDGDGLDEINTEIVYFQLTGGGIKVSESPTQASNGLIEEQANVMSGQLDFPANSFFDVFFEVDVGGGVILHNDVPFRVQCKIEEIPPYGCLYVPPIPEPVVLNNVDEVKIATLLHGLHIPVGPKQKLVIFANRQKDETPTATPTPPTAATSTPTDTPMLPTATPTRTNTPRPTATRTPEGLCGDANKDGSVNSIDAAITLQFVAGLLDELEHADNAETNGDGRVNAIDAAIMLQIDAGLISSCPAG
jgi:hypothetical protein